MLKKNIFSILVALIIMYLSLADSDTFKKIPVYHIHFMDKIVHFLMYFGLMTIILFENRKTMKNVRQLLLLSLIPLSYGILIEFLQATLTVSRSGSIYDALTDLAGILASVFLWLMFIRPYNKPVI